MSAARSNYGPLALQMEVEFLDRLSEPVRERKAVSVSDIIRAALARFDFSKILVVHPAQLTISVRLPARIRQELRKTARIKHTSVGHLVRTAVEAYLPQLEAQTLGQLEMPIAVPISHSPAGRKKKRRTPPRPATQRTPRRKRHSMTKKRKG
jgi:hypothetical protein